MEHFYTKLFQHLFGNRIDIRRVTGVGGKHQVLERFDQLRNNPKNTKEFYLVDGDFDELIGVSIPSHFRLYRLPRYDIENFLVEPKAVAAVAQEQHPKLGTDHYLKKLDFQRWQDSLAKRICRLIACHALLQTLKCSPRGAGSSILRFTSGNDNLPNEDEISRYINDHCNGQSELTTDEFDRELQDLVGRMGTSSAQILRWASGKKVILPLIICFLKSETSQNISLDSLRFRLVGFCRLDGLSELRDIVLRFHSSAMP